MIGRARERRLLGEELEAAAAGRTRVALVAGDPGIGKSSLLAAVAGDAAAAGATVLRGGASEAEGMPPYLPFLEALGGHVRSAPVEAVRAQAGDLAPVLAGILPELALRLRELPASYPLPPDQARLRLFEAVGTMLAGIAAPAPLVLLLDDLHWADAASLDLLCHVARRHPALRLLVLGAFRAGDAAGSPAFARALDELNRLRVLRSVALGPLPDAELARLAAARLGAELESGAAAVLAATSEGNPFFAEELLRGWRESGDLVEGDGGWRLAGARPPSLPPTLVAAIRQRLSRLPEETVAMLGVAAVLGRSFDVDTLAEVAGGDTEAVEERLRTAERAALLGSDGRGGFSFAHDRVRECLYEDVPAVRRRRLHGLAGHALEGRPDGGIRRQAELAHHFARSGDRACGAEHAAAAGRQALGALAAAEARGHLGVALQLIPPDDERRGELLALLGDEFGMSPTCEPALFGPARNPWDARRSTGGSSGGSAAAVASGMVPMAHGNDLGGSIRYPASCCGLFGLKPTRARNPLGPEYGDVASGLAVEHALTRSVRDSAALLDATAGPDLGDPYWAPPPARPFLAEVGADPGRLRIAFTTRAPGGQPVHPHCVEAARDAARLCDRLGHEVVERDLPEIAPRVGAAIGAVLDATVAWTVGYWIRRLGRTPRDGELEPATRAAWADGRAVTAAAYLLAVDDLRAFGRRVERALTEVDVWLTPTLGEPPPPLGEIVSTEAEPDRAARRMGTFVSFAGIVANITGGPAMSVPLHWSPDRLPIGVHFLGRFGDEATLLRLASQLEVARAWADRWPDPGRTPLAAPEGPGSATRS